MPVRGSVIAEIGYDVLHTARTRDERKRNGIINEFLDQLGLFSDDIIILLLL